MALPLPVAVAIPSTTTSDGSVPESPWNVSRQPRADPLKIPEIIELILVQLLSQFQSSSQNYPHHPFAASSQTSSSFSSAAVSSVSLSSSSLLTTNQDIQFQIRAQRPVSTRLAFLRVCQLWYQVGEPLLWKDVKWADYQSPIVHQRIWEHWSRVRRLEFEYGKRTTDTELVSISDAVGTTAVAVPPSSTVSTWVNGPRARMRNLLGGDPLLATTTGAGSTADVGAPDTSTAVGHPGLNGSRSDVFEGRPRISLTRALDGLARALSQPSTLSHYCPKPLPLHEIQLHKRLPDFDFACPTPTRSLPPPMLHRSQLTHLTVTGHFRLETFLETILPFLPELTYLDICLRCYEWRDEIRLDKVLRTCPKLQHLCVDRNMFGRVAFSEPSSDEDESDEEDDCEDVDDNGQSNENYGANAVYKGTPWHLKFARIQSNAYRTVPRGGNTNACIYPNLSDDQKDQEDQRSGATASIVAPMDAKPTSSGSLAQPHERRRSRKQRQRPLALRVLKLKKVRMTERDFLELIQFCPLLEELDVFSTIYWGWRRSFLETVAKACPRIRHLHLTTNYETAASENDNSNAHAMQAGIVIFHETPQDQTHSPADPAGDSFSFNALSLLDPTLSSSSSPFPSSLLTSSSPYDPVVELIKLFPALLSYDARYVRFQDKALVTLQQHCRQLESLDLTSCREVSSKAVDWFLRRAPTLRHFSASRIMLRIEDMIESVECHKRAATFSGGISTVSEPPRWWACENLETFIVGIKNPALSSSSRNDLRSEHTTDFQFYYRDYQGGSSSHNYSGSGPGSKSTLTQHDQQKQYDHTQYCTYVLFQQLGRLRKLKRLELHGGRFDLRIELPPLSLSPSCSGSSSLSSLHSLTASPSQGLSEIGLESESKEGDKDSRIGYKARQSFMRMKSFLTQVGSNGKGKQTLDESSSGSSVQVKKHTKSKDQGKNKVQETPAGHSQVVSNDADVKICALGHGEHADCVRSDKEGADSYADCRTGRRSLEEQEAIVPSRWRGLQPLRGLVHLRSFSMTWSNFPQLKEQEMAWICQYWTSLEWISLGLVPESEWNQIRHWVRSRRPDIVVVFER
ncbi:hypothetical protein BGX28_003119 [Mortierella sp. GBA30]|nr:hypothetical protein BGX28_003119 [Mortierella sp. GBA30]